MKKKRLTITIAKAIIIALAMLLSCVTLPMVYAEPEKGFELGEAEKILSLLEIIPQKAVETDTDAISRAEFAVWAARAIGLNDYDKADKRYFTDIPMEHWATFAVNALADRQIISVPKDRKFYPENEMSMAEATKIMVCILGYQSVAEQEGGFPYGYQSVAARLKLTRGMNFSGALTLSTARMLMYNSLKCRLYTVNEVKVEDDEPYSVMDEGQDTLFSLYWSIYDDSGFVTGDYGASLSGKKISDKNGLMIEDTDFVCDDTVACDDLVGRYVHFFYTMPKDESERVIISLTENPSKEDMITLHEEMLSTYSNGKLTYYHDNGKSDTANIEPNAAVIYNGALANNQLETGLVLNKGSMRLSDTDSNGSYDVIVIWEYENIVAGGIDSANKVVYDKNTPSTYVTLDESAADALEILGASGEQKTFEDIKAGMVLTVYRTEKFPQAKQFVRIHLCSASISGTLESLTDEEIVLGGTGYKLDKDFAEEYTDRLKVGSKYVLLLDYVGKVAGISTGGNNTMLYGYLVKAEAEQGIAKTLQLKLFTQSKVMTVSSCAKSVVVDGERRTGAEQILAGLKNWKSDIVGQMLRYSLNRDGDIQEIDTAFQGTKETEYSLQLQGKENLRSYYSYSGQFGSDIILGGKTLYFCIPPDNLLASASDSDFRILDRSFFDMPGKSTNLLTCSYVVGTDSGLAGVVVYKGDLSEGKNKRAIPILVTGISKVMDDEGNTVDYLTGYEADSKVGYKAVNGVSLAGEVEPGDLITVNKNIDNNIVSVSLMIYHYQSGSASPIGWGLYGDDYSWDTFVSGGYAISLFENVLAIGYSDVDTISERINLYDLPLAVYNGNSSKKDKVEFKSADRIFTAQLKSEKAERVIVFRQNQIPRCIYIWEN